LGQRKKQLYLSDVGQVFSMCGALDNLFGSDDLFTFGAMSCNQKEALLFSLNAGI